MQLLIAWMIQACSAVLALTPLPCRQAVEHRTLPAGRWYLSLGGEANPLEDGFFSDGQWGVALVMPGGYAGKEWRQLPLESKSASGKSSGSWSFGFLGAGFQDEREVRVTEKQAWEDQESGGVMHKAHLEFAINRHSRYYLRILSGALTLDERFHSKGELWVMVDPKGRVMGIFRLDGRFHTTPWIDPARRPFFREIRFKNDKSPAEVRFGLGFSSNIDGTKPPKAPVRKVLEVLLSEGIPASLPQPIPPHRLSAPDFIPPVP